MAIMAKGCSGRQADVFRQTPLCRWDTEKKFENCFFSRTFLRLQN